MGSLKEWYMVLFAGLLLAGCGGSSEQTWKYTEKKAWFHEDEFARDDTLYAKIENPVILKLHPSSQLAENTGRHEVRYSYEESGEYVFCIEDNDPYITEMSLRDLSGNEIVHIERKEGCKEVYLEAGKYAIEVIHDGDAVPSQRSVAFVHSPTVYDKNSSLEGNLSVAYLEKNEQTPYYIVAVEGGTFDKNYLAFTRMEDIDHTLEAKAYSASGAAWRDPWYADDLYFLSAVSRRTTTIEKNLFYTDFKKKEHLFSIEKGRLKPYSDRLSLHAPYKNFEVDASGYFVGLCMPMGSSNLDPVLYPQSAPLAFCGEYQDPEKVSEYPTSPFMAKFAEGFYLTGQVSGYYTREYTPDSVPLYARWEDGSVFTLYNKEKKYKDPYGYHELSRSSVYIDTNRLLYRTAASRGPQLPTKFNIYATYYDDGSKHKLAPDEVAISSSCNLVGPTLILKENYARIDDALADLIPEIRSVAFGSDKNNLVFFAEKNYESWERTVGRDLHCLSEPIALKIGASLKVLEAKKVLIASKMCDYCDLAGADLSNLSLENVSLHAANLTNTRLNNSEIKMSDMRYAKLYGANLNYSNLEGSTLCGAFLNGNDKSFYTAATLTGAYMKNVNLTASNLNGTDFSYANFYSDTSGSCMAVNCGFTNCSTVSEATMQNTNFNNSYLAGTDFSNSTIYGTNFTNAILVGATFKSSTIGRNKETGAPSSFNGAFLQGTDFSYTNVKSTNFNSAYVDLNATDGNLLFFLLDANHASFAGWTPQNEPVCTMYAYNHTTVPPHIDSTSTCPDGSSGDCGKRWESPKIPMSKSLQKASYYNDPSPVCTDPAW